MSRKEEKRLIAKYLRTHKVVPCEPTDKWEPVNVSVPVPVEDKIV